MLTDEETRRSNVTHQEDKDLERLRVPKDAL